MSEIKPLTSITDRISADGSSGYKAEKERYHLYISRVCPFAHRITVALELKGLQDVISICNVSPIISNLDIGWEFDSDREGCGPDTVNGKKYLREVYEMSHPEYKGRITVPCLFDKVTKKIVNNESAQILRMLSTEFNDFCATEGQRKLNFYPEELKQEIDQLVDFLNANVVYGVYKSTSVETQQEYEASVNSLFDALDKIDSMLSTKRFLFGPQLTEADIKLFVVLVRFDSVYYGLFKCCKKAIREYEHLWPYLRDIYQMGSVSNTVKMNEIKEGYWCDKRRLSQKTLFIPVGPDLDFDKKTDRA